MFWKQIVYCILISSLSWGYASPSSAQTMNAKKAPAKPKPIPKRPTPLPPAPSPAQGFVVPESENWSQLSQNSAKNHQLGVSGIVNFFGEGFGLEYIHAQSDWLDWGVSLIHTNAKLEKDSIPEAVEFLDSSLNAVRVFTRYIAFRQLYAGLGLNYGSIAGDYGWKGEAVTRGSIKTAFHSQVAAFEIFVGSEWEGPWGSYIGVDWVGFAHPIYGQINYDEELDVELTSRALAGADPNERIEEEITAQLKLFYLNLRIGFSF